MKILVLVLLTTEQGWNGLIEQNSSSLGWDDIETVYDKVYDKVLIHWEYMTLKLTVLQWNTFYWISGFFGLVVI